MASKQLAGFGKELGGVGAFGKVAAVGMAGVAAAGLGLVAGIGSAIGEAMDFESAMSAVAAVAGGTDADLKRLSDTALQLGQDTTLSGVGATDAARAMRELAAAGMSVEDIVGGGALGALRLASAGGIDVGRAAEIASMALANFGLSGSEAANVADLFASAANSSAISVDDIAEALKYVGPIANSMGLSIEEVTATIAALGNQGIKASQAGTSLRSMLVNLAKPSKEANKIIKSLGLEFFNANGEMKSLADVSEELKVGMKDLTDQQRAAALSTLFGNEALTAATVLYGEGADGINKWLKEIEDGATAAEVGAKRNNNLKGSLEALKGSAETALIAFGMGLTPALKDLTLGLANGVSAAIPFLTMIGAGLGKALAAGIGGLQEFGGYVAGVATALVGAFQKLQAGEITLAQFIGGVKSLVTTVLGDIGTLLGNVAGFLAPFLTKIGDGIRLALPVIGAELLKLGQAFGGWIVTTAIPYLQTNLPLWLTALSTWVTGTALPAIWGFVASIGAAFGGWITGTAIPYLRDNLPGWLDALGSWVTTTAVPAVTGFLVAVGTAFGDWVATRAVPWVQENLPGYLAAIGTWVTETAVPAVTSFLVAVGTAFGDWVSTKAVPYVLEKLPEWKTAIESWIGTTAIPAIEAHGAALAGALGDWVVNEAIPQLEADLPGITKAINDALAEANAAADTGATAIANILGNFIGDKVLPTLTADIGKTALIMVAWFPAVLIAATKFTTDLGTQAAKWFGSDQQATLRTNLAAFGNAISTWILTMTFLLPVLAFKLGTAITTSLANGIKEKWGELSAWLSGLPDRIKAAVGDMSRTLFVSGANLMQGLINGILSKMGALSGVGGQIASTVAGAVAGGLQERSPSRLAMKMGRDFVEGLVIGMDEKEQEAAKKAADVAASVAKAVTDVLGAARSLSGFDFKRNTPTGEQMGWFRHLTESLVTTMQEAAKGFSEEGLKAATEFSDAAGKVGSAVKNAVDGLLALGKADWATSSPTGSAMGWFTHLISSLVENFARAGAEFQGDALKVAGEFADAAGKVGGSVKNGVEGLKSLASADWAESSPSGSAMGWFTHLIASLTQNFATAAKDFDEGALGAASAFADSAGKVVATIGPAVQGFAAMATMAAPSEGAIDSLLAGVKRIVGRFAGMAKEMDAEGIKATGDFASAAGTALGAAKTGVELFAAMAGDKDKAGNHVPLMPPSAQAIDNLMAAIRYVIGKFREMAASMEQEGIAQMQTFATASGQVLGAAKAGTDLFKGMENLAVPAKESIDYLLGNIGYVISQTRAIATGIGTEGLKEAQSFATGSLTVITTIKNTLEMFKQIDAVKDIPAKILEDLHTALEGALDFAHKNFLRAEAIKTEAQAFLKSMQDAFHAFTQAQSLANGMGSMAITAPAGVGGGASGGGGGGGGGTVNNYTINTGDVYDGAKFEDRVVEAITTADRRGR